MSRPEDQGVPLSTRIVDKFMRGDAVVLWILLALILGAAALLLTPREEEPQIVVPLADVLISAPGLPAEEVEQQITLRLEKLLYQIDGVEYVYSMTRFGESIVTVRFYVGEDREDSILKLYNKIHSNLDQLPPSVASWVVKPIEIDDVPIVTVTLWSERPELYSDHELRRIAGQLQAELQAVPNTNRVSVIGGRPRRIRVLLDPARLAARQTSALDVAHALKVSNVHRRAGSVDQLDREMIVDAGTYFQDARDLENLVVRVSGGFPVYLRDVAEVVDGPAEPESYSWMGFGPADDQRHGAAGASTADGFFPAVHLAAAKRRGTNAVWVSDDLHRRMRALAPKLLPEGVHYRITRDYGATANEKVGELVEGLVVAVLTVIGLIGLVLGWRPALVIALAVPVTYSVTLFVNLMVGYTINRVTMFALILSLGLLVDDPITDVENIARYFAKKVRPPRLAVLRAVQEVRPALVYSTLAIIASFLPLMFITGMMGPYMAPMAMNVPLTVTVSTLVSFLITPWLAMVALRPRDESPAAAAEGAPDGGDDRDGGDADADAPGGLLYGFYRNTLGAILERRWLCWSVLGVIFLLLVASLVPGVLRLVPLKMLPYDNKNEFQIVIDMPEGTTLERTDAVARQLAGYLLEQAEVRDVQVFSGSASPMDFNGMVRHYFLRSRPHEADLRVNLADKDRRAQQSHEILLRLRDELTRRAERLGANVKLVEVPPGPPVIATITAEIYGPPEAAYADLAAQAQRVANRLFIEPGVVDVDTSGEADQTVWLFQVDKEKAALSGVSTETIARTVELALSGLHASVLHHTREIDPLLIELRVPRAIRSARDDLEELYLRGDQGQIVQLGALGDFVEQVSDKTIFRKNLRRVAYVFAEVAGRPPAEAILDMQLDRREAATLRAAEAVDHASIVPDPLRRRPALAAAHRTWLNPGGGELWSTAPGYEVHWAGEGEWKITLDVFRDLGIAFAAAQIGIFIILMFETRSRVLPLVIMLAIPLTLIGVMPGFWLLNVLTDRPVGGHPNPVFFTATAMIGMIALSGIVVRNSLVLIEFIHQAREAGVPLKEALVQSVAVRTRPILLTAGTTLLGNWVITLDPIFSGLAWSIIFGIFASTVFTLVVIPVTYWLLFGGQEARRRTAALPQSPPQVPAQE